MELRPFQDADLERLYDIDQACFPAGVSYSREELKSFIRAGDCETWVAHEGDTIVGFVVADRGPEQVVHIITLDVVEGWRRRGVASVLMDVAEAWAKQQGARLMYLETAEDNLGAQKFYQARGYTKVERVANYYANGAAAWIMLKPLGKGNR